jgi:hypothetical protein
MQEGFQGLDFDSIAKILQFKEAIFLASQLG